MEDHKGPVNDETPSRAAVARELLYAVFLLGISVGPILVALGVLGWQTIHWLQFNEWQSVSFLDLLAWAGIRPGWVNAPTSWFGLWRFLNWLPLSLAAFLYGALMLIALASDR